jgi:hypothetical protein
MKRRENRQTFRELYEGLEGNNADKLMDRARTANRIAKTMQTARARLGAYRVKHNALLALKEKFPTKVMVSLDPQYGSYFVLVKDMESRFGLHAPARFFERTAA